MDADLHRSLLDNALRACCATKEGRLLLAHLIYSTCHLEAQNPATEHGAAQRFEGARDVGLHLRNELVRVDPELFHAVMESRFTALILPQAPKK